MWIYALFSRLAPSFWGIYGRRPLQPATCKRLSDLEQEKDLQVSSTLIGGGVVRSPFRAGCGETCAGAGGVDEIRLTVVQGFLSDIRSQG